MTSKTVYDIFKGHIVSPLKEAGYKKAKSSMLGYTKSINDDYLSFWIQCSRDGFDQYAGSKFIIQFSVTKTAAIGFSGSDGGRIPKYLTVEELEQVRTIQNTIIQSLHRPPRSYLPATTAANVVDWYMRKFDPEREPYTVTSDIWFRYYSEADVKAWSHYLSPIIFRTLSTLELRHR